MRNYEDLEVLEKQMDKAKAFLSQTIIDKLVIINDHLRETGGLVLHTKDPMPDTDESHVILNNIYMKLTAPHKLPRKG